MKKVSIFVGSRANYSSIKSVMQSVKDHKDLQLQLILGSSAVLDSRGELRDLILQDGFTIAYEFFNILEGDSPLTMAKSTGLGIIESSNALYVLQPNFLVVVGDRFEVMSLVISAAYMNIRIVHTMGGEVTGTIDESIRHAITKFAHIHCVANDDAKSRVLKLGEDEKFVFNTGCPRNDLIAKELKQNSYDVLNNFFKDYPLQNRFKFLENEHYLVVSQHSVTTEYGKNKDYIKQTLEALQRVQIPTLLLLPNIDAGGEEIHKGIDEFINEVKPKWLNVCNNLPNRIYIHMMNTTSCLVGNSSSGVREGEFIGTPVVNIGTRQFSRLRGDNVIDVDNDFYEIMTAIKKQIGITKYKSGTLYGSGTSGKQIADIISKVNVPIQKTITY